MNNIIENIMKNVKVLTNKVFTYNKQKPIENKNNDNNFRPIFLDKYSK